MAEDKKEFPVTLTMADRPETVYDSEASVDIDGKSLTIEGENGFSLNVRPATFWEDAWEDYGPWVVGLGSLGLVLAGIFWLIS